MNYIPNYHAECFSTNLDVSQKCITQGINYHLMDIRLGSRLLNLHPDDKPKDTVNILYPELSLKPNRKSKISKAKNFKESFNIYENWLSYKFRNFLSEHRSFDHNKPLRINNYSILKIVKLVYNDPKKLANILFDFNNPLIQKSKLYQSISKLVDEYPNIIMQEYIKNKLHGLFVDYFVFVINNDKEINDDEFKKRTFIWN